MSDPNDLDREALVEEVERLRFYLNLAKEKQKEAEKASEDHAALIDFIIRTAHLNHPTIPADVARDLAVGKITLQEAAAAQNEHTFPGRKP